MQSSTLCARRRMGGRKGGKIPHPHKTDDGKNKEKEVNNRESEKKSTNVISPSDKDNEREKRNESIMENANFIKMSVLSPLFELIFDDSDESNSDDSDDEEKNTPVEQ